MKEMKIYIFKISALCRLRYKISTTELLSTNSACTIAETLDEEIRKNIIDMKDKFSINEGNVELFLKFFWGLLEEEDTWLSSVSEFGKDWDFTKEMLSEMLKETLRV